LRAIGVQTCVLHTDSKVVLGQIEKECIAREPTLENFSRKFMHKFAKVTSVSVR
jgi:ribonuclease HI